MPNNNTPNCFNNGSNPNGGNYTDDPLSTGGGDQSGGGGTSSNAPDTPTQTPENSVDTPLNQVLAIKQSTTPSTSHDTGALVTRSPFNPNYDGFNIYGNTVFGGTCTGSTAGFFYINIKIYRTSAAVEVEDNILCMIYPNSTQQKTIALDYFFKVIPVIPNVTGPYKVTLGISDIYGIDPTSLKLNSYTLKFNGILNSNT